MVERLIQHEAQNAHYLVHIASLSSRQIEPRLPTSDAGGERRVKRAYRKTFS